MMPKRVLRKKPRKNLRSRAKSRGHVLRRVRTLFSLRAYCTRRGLRSRDLVFRFPALRRAILDVAKEISFQTRAPVHYLCMQIFKEWQSRSGFPPIAVGNLSNFYSPLVLSLSRALLENTVLQRAAHLNKGLDAAVNRWMRAYYAAR